MTWLMFVAGFALGIVCGTERVRLWWRGFVTRNIVADDPWDRSTPFLWMDLRDLNDRLVAENRRKAAASDPHGLHVVRDDFDRSGGDSW